MRHIARSLTRLALRSLTASMVAAAVVAANAAEPVLSVTFIHPEAYTDAVIATPAGPDLTHLEVQKGIRDHLAMLAARDLPAGQSLDIQILDIDLAGRAHPPRAGVGSDFRVVREEDWPRISLRYTLKRGHQVLAAQPDSLSDQDFLHHANRYPTGDKLRYEKALLDEWFAKRVATQH